MRLVSIPLVLVIALSAAPRTLAQADHAHHGKKAHASPYAGRTGLAVKALTDEAIEALRTGKGMGLAMPAELNGYPGPRHVLDMADALALTAEQRAAMQELFDRMLAAAVRIGSEIVDLEARLDRAFASGSITSEELASLTRQIAERQGSLRFTHLEAHIAAKALLTAEQVAGYNRARGY